MKRRTKAKKSNIDLGLLIVILILSFLGAILVYDASVVRAAGIFGGKYYFLIFQLIWVFLGLIILSLATHFDLALLETISTKLLVLSLVLLLLTIFTRFLPVPLRGFSEIFIPSINGSHRWIYLNYKPLPALPLVGRLGFQPSELAKISLVLFLSFTLSNKKRGLTALKSILVVGLMSLLTLLQPDFGTALIIALTGIAVYLASGAALKHIAFLLFLVVILGIFFIMTSGYRRERFLSYLNLSPNRQESLSSKYQINQILIALGSGGFFGLGLGQSRQKYDYIPEVNTDSIFSVWGEETGLVGSLLLILLFCLLVYKGFMVAVRSARIESALLAVGITSFIGLQALINLAGMTHLLPLTGVPLPLLSYGGSSLLAVMFSLGILLNVSRDLKDRPEVYGR